MLLQQAQTVPKGRNTIRKDRAKLSRRRDNRRNNPMDRVTVHRRLERRDDVAAEGELRTLGAGSETVSAGDPEGAAAAIEGRRAVQG